jgi:hypothetical protein
VHQLHIQVVNQKESEDDPSYNPIKFNLGLQGLFNNTNTAVLIAGFKNPDPLLISGLSVSLYLIMSAVKRSTRLADAGPAKGMRVVTYNILCERLASTNQFPHCDP